MSPGAQSPNNEAPGRKWKVKNATNQPTSKCPDLNTPSLAVTSPLNYVQTLTLQDVESSLLPNMSCWSNIQSQQTRWSHCKLLQVTAAFTIHHICSAARLDWFMNHLVFKTSGQLNTSEVWAVRRILILEKLIKILPKVENERWCFLIFNQQIYKQHHVKYEKSCVYLVYDQIFYNINQQT